MKRTKPRVTNSLSSSRSISTQTENFDSLIEVAKLEEQVRVLQLENNVLRKYAKISNNSEVVHHKSVYLAPQATSKTPKTEKSSCGCKGNCSSRICGCVKKSNKCSPSCKCDEKMCQNQKMRYNQENKENVNRTDMETPKKQSKKKNDVIEKTTNNKSLFSPDVKETYKDLQESQFSDIHFSFNEKDKTIKNSDSHNINVKLRKKRNEKKEENDKVQQESVEKITFDPMKPRHQLTRTPPNSKKHEKPALEALEVKNAIQPPFQLYSEPTQEVEIISPKIQDIRDEKVNWEEHTAQLIPCKKCKRTFLPDRIQKHQACCKKI